MVELQSYYEYDNEDVLKEEDPISQGNLCLEPIKNLKVI